MTDEQTSTLRIVCPQCGPQIGHMRVSASANNAGCDSCGYGSSADVDVEVECTKCQQVIWQKDFEGA